MNEVRTQRPKSDRKTYGLLTIWRFTTFFASQLTIEIPSEANRGPPVINGWFCALQICFESHQKKIKAFLLSKKTQCLFTNFQKILIFIQKSSGKRWIKQFKKKHQLTRIVRPVHKHCRFWTKFQFSVKKIEKPQVAHLLEESY